jgi:hypothetical protein
MANYVPVDPVCARDVRLNAVLHLEDEVLASFEGEDSSGAIAFRIGPSSIRLSTIEVLERWRQEGTPLATFVSIEHELVGLVHEPTGRAIAGVLIEE